MALDPYLVSLRAQWQSLGTSVGLGLERLVLGEACNGWLSSPPGPSPTASERGGVFSCRGASRRGAVSAPGPWLPAKNPGGAALGEACLAPTRDRARRSSGGETPPGSHVPASRRGAVSAPGPPRHRPRDCLESGRFVGWRSGRGELIKSRYLVGWRGARCDLTGYLMAPICLVISLVRQIGPRQCVSRPAALATLPPSAATPVVSS